MATGELIYSYPFLGVGYEDWPNGSFELNVVPSEAGGQRVVYSIGARTPRGWVRSGKVQVVVLVTCPATRHREVHVVPRGETGFTLELDPEVFSDEIRLFAELVAAKDCELSTSACRRDFWRSARRMRVVRGQILGRTDQVRLPLKEEPRKRESYVRIRQAGPLSKYSALRVGFEGDYIYVLLANELYAKYVGLRERQAGRADTRLRNAVAIQLAVAEAVARVRAHEERRRREREDDEPMDAEEWAELPKWHQIILTRMREKSLSFEKAGEAEIANEALENIVGDALSRLVEGYDATELDESVADEALFAFDDEDEGNDGRSGEGGEA